LAVERHSFEARAVPAEPDLNEFTVRSTTLSGKKI
jgi:hypothetical protein